MTNTTLALASDAAMTYSKDQVDLIKRTIAKGATDDELAMFLGTCARLRMDPFARQIYCMKRWDPVEQKEVATTFVGIDGYRLVAERTGNYAPGPAPLFKYDHNDQLFSATAYVMKWVHGTWIKGEAEVFYNESVQRKKDGQPNKRWSEAPRMMLAKCAEALCLRKAFPHDLGGTQIPEEDRGAEEPVERFVPPPVSTRDVIAQVRGSSPAAQEYKERVASKIDQKQDVYDESRREHVKVDTPIRSSESTEKIRDELNERFERESAGVKEPPKPFDDALENELVARMNTAADKMTLDAIARDITDHLSSGQLTGYQKEALQKVWVKNNRRLKEATTSAG